MTTEDFISEVFYRVDEAMKAEPKHPQASLWPSEVVTRGVLFALKGVGNRAFYRWVSRDWRGSFSTLPQRTPPFPLFPSPPARRAQVPVASPAFSAVGDHRAELSPA